MHQLTDSLKILNKEINYQKITDLSNKELYPEYWEPLINKLEKMYRYDKITHARNVQIVNVMTQRLRVILKNTKKGQDRFELSNKYFKHLKRP